MTSKTLFFGIGLTASAFSLGGPRSAPRAHSVSGRVEINAERTTIRVSPLDGSKAVSSADHGTEGKILALTPKWARLRFVTGLTGWVRRDTLRPAASPDPKPVAETHGTLTMARVLPPAAEKVAASTNKRSELLSKARSFRGVRYVYGAASRSATDCSGFTTQVFRAIGVKLPRVSFAQARVGTAVAKPNLAPGDLIFFRTRGGYRVSHVGIYVGEGRFIHASSSSGRVTYNGLNESYYRTRYAGARRVVPVGTIKPEVAAATVVREAKKMENQMWVNPEGETDGGSGEIER